MTKLPAELEARASELWNLIDDHNWDTGTPDNMLDFARACYEAGWRGGAEATNEAVKKLVLLHKDLYIGGGAEAWAIADVFERIKYDLTLPAVPE